MYIKYINDTSAWVALREASQAKAMNTILPKLQALHKNIVLLPWSVYYNIDINVTTATKRKINECSLSPPKDNLDSSISRDEHAVGETPEKVQRISKGLAVFIFIHLLQSILSIFCIYLFNPLLYRRRVSKGRNISPILEGDESAELGNIITNLLDFTIFLNKLNTVLCCSKDI